MIIEFIVSALLFIPNVMLSLLPVITFGAVPQSALITLHSFIGFVAILFPLSALMPIIIANLMLDIFRIIVALGVRVKSFIPFMPGG